MWSSYLRGLLRRSLQRLDRGVHRPRVRPASHSSAGRWLTEGPGTLEVGPGQLVVSLEPSKDNTLYENTSGNVSNAKGLFLFTGRRVYGRVPTMEPQAA